MLKYLGVYMILFSLRGFIILMMILKSGVQLAKYTSSVDEDSRQNARQSMNIVTILQ